MIIAAPGGGLSFSVPAATAKFVVSELLGHGYVRRAGLGILGQTVNVPLQLARALKLPRATTVECVAAVEDGPAAAAGLQPGDWVVAVDSEPVTTMDGLFKQVANRTVGSAVMLSILRARGTGKAENVVLNLGPASISTSATAGGLGQPNRPNWQRAKDGKSPAHNLLKRLRGES
eukprot:SAG31_NODE_1169_length_9565_cov_3.703571_5_plen_175_part_00